MNDNVCSVGSYSSVEWWSLEKTFSFQVRIWNCCVAGKLWLFVIHGRLWVCVREVLSRTQQLSAKGKAALCKREIARLWIWVKELLWSSGLSATINTTLALQVRHDRHDLAATAALQERWLWEGSIPGKYCWLPIQWISSLPLYQQKRGNLIWGIDVWSPRGWLID